MVASSILGRDNMDNQFHAMRDKFERQSKVLQSSVEEKFPQLPHEWGKGKNALTEEGFP